MQRRRQSSSSGELDVFGATRYFYDGLADCATSSPPVDVVMKPEDLMTQAKMTQDRNHLGAKTKGKGKLAAFFGALVSPEASFGKKPAPAPSSTTPTGDEPPKISTSSSSRRSSHDLGVVIGDRRLRGVMVVRGSGGDEESWVVRCSAWEEEEEHRGKMFDAASSDDPQVGAGEVNGDDHGWDSDSSSDLFELDLQDMIFPANC